MDCEANMSRPAEFSVDLIGILAFVDNFFTGNDGFKPAVFAVGTKFSKFVEIFKSFWKFSKIPGNF